MASNSDCLLNATEPVQFIINLKTTFSLTLELYKEYIVLHWKGYKLKDKYQTD